MSVRSGNASTRDRTHEFLGIAQRVGESVSAQNVPSSSGTKRVPAMQLEFNRRASKIGLGIHQSSLKLAKLAKLAKRTSGFDEPAIEIQELTALVKQDITALISAVVDLQYLCNSGSEGGNISSDTTSHSTTVVDDPTFAAAAAATTNPTVTAIGSASGQLHSEQSRGSSKCGIDNSGAGNHFQSVSYLG